VEAEKEVVLEELFVGIDWATKEHEVCVVDARGEVLATRVVSHGAEGLAELCDWLRALEADHAAAAQVAIEVPHGAVVETLLGREFAVYAINPKQLDRFRDRFTVAGAKDDRRDALVLAQSLRTDKIAFRRVELDHPVIIELREISRMAADLQEERTRIANRMRDLLRRYFPQLLELTDDVGASWFLALWELVPRPSRARRVREATIAKLLKKYRIRRLETKDVLEVLRLPPLRVAKGTEAAAIAHLTVLVEQIRLVSRQIKEAHRNLDELMQRFAQDDEEGKPNEQCDVRILRSLPGIGRINLAALLAEAHKLLATRDYHALRAHTGTAPVTRRSGKKHIVVMRKACNSRLREAVYHWARVASQRDPATQARYRALRARGHSHGRALRTVADRLLAVACAMLRSGQPFDPAYAEAA
jgi:transposase